MTNVVLVAFTESSASTAITQVEKVFRSSSLESRTVVLNGPGVSDLVVPDGWRSLTGSNSLGEFSGWQEALEHLRRPFDGDVLFVNDTLGAHRHPSMFRRWALRTQIEQASGARMIGFTEDSHDPVEGMQIADMALSGWVSTYCFMLTADALRLLGGRLYIAGEVEACVHGGLDINAFFSERLSPNLRRHLQWWLFSRWHRSESLTASSEPRLKLKARCICAELLLSARCRALGITLTDPFREQPVARSLESANRWRVAHLRRSRQQSGPGHS